MVQTILDGKEFPVIGNFFTPDEFLGNGNGTSILMQLPEAHAA
ncbi:MAG: hypothetical protein ACJ748_03805 [Flavisolibacter sp.]